jgi:hypothetical protein
VVRHRHKIIRPTDFFYVQPKNLRIVGTYNRYEQRVKFRKKCFTLKMVCFYIRLLLVKSEVYVNN